MNVSKNNPSTNTLPRGLTESTLVDAITNSGYPLQTVVANCLRKIFNTQEEWSFIDRDTQKLRTMDILAHKYLFDIKNIQPVVRPSLSLLVECKRSADPYVFFLSPNKPWLPYYPVISGLRNETMEITTDTSLSSWQLPVLTTLGLDVHDFLAKDALNCMTFSKVERNSKNRLSGEEPFNTLILPLIKSMQHFFDSEKPPNEAMHFDGHMTVGIGVLDAAMFGVINNGGLNEITALPWIRVIKHESYNDNDRSKRFRSYAIDIVHKDFFEKYINEHLMPFAEEYSKLVLKHQEVLAAGKGYITGMDTDSWGNFEQRLKHQGVDTTVRRVNSRIKWLVKLFVAKISGKSLEEL